jgi:peptide methionine sulfoxide reductase msrA/msrB
MKTNLITFGILIILAFTITKIMTAQNNKTYNPLTPEEERVILKKGTEAPYSGEYYTHTESGTYTCKRCDAPLYRSSDKFDAQCGWPSFDDEIDGAIKKVTDADGRRTEILCSNCGGHLGHVFVGERFTSKNTRHCVNSISLNFEPLIATQKIKTNTTETAIFAGGCFWGMEYYFSTAKGVTSTQVGYIGGKSQNPTYEEVCSHQSGHIEAIEVVYNTSETDFETMAKLFFEIHDPGQLNRQGPDVGEQYKSAIFYTDDQQKEISEKLIKILQNKNIKVVTELKPATQFWPAEQYHQDYYDRRGNRPYCHFYEKKF